MPVKSIVNNNVSTYAWFAKSHVQRGVAKRYVAEKALVVPSLELTVTDCTVKNYVVL